MRSNKNPPDVTAIAEESASEKKPYVFSRAFARLLGVDEGQAVAGYLASTGLGEPNPTNPEKAARSANAPSESSPGGPITQTGGGNRKLTEIPNPPNMKRPAVGEIQARVTKSVPAQGKGNLGTSLLLAKPPRESDLGRPISQTGGESRKLTDIPNPPNTKLPPVGEIEARVAKSVATEGENNRATSLPPAKAPLESSLRRTSQAGDEGRNVTEIRNPPNMKFPPVGEVQARVTKSPPAQTESDRVTSAKAPCESNPGRPIIQTGGENRKVTEIPNLPNKFPPVGEIEPRVTKSLPAQGESNRANSLLQAKAPPESSPGRPISQKAGENQEVKEISHPSIVKLPPIEAWVTKSTSTRGESDRPSNFSWEAFFILLLVVSLGFAVWQFYTRDTRVHAVPPNWISSASISPPASVTSAKATKGLPSFEVRIKAHKNARVLIKADGRKVTEEILTDGAERSVRAANQVIVKSGNLGALDVEFNGRRLPIQGAYGEVKTLEFGPSGLEVIISNPPTRIKPGE